MGRRGATTIAALALLLAGCGGGGDAATDGTGGSTSPSPAPSSTASSSVASPTETPEPTSTVEPATGVELEVQGFRVNGLEKWRITNSFVTTETATGPVGDGRYGGVLLGIFPASKQVSLAQAMRKSWQPGARPPGFEERPTTSLGGLSAFSYTAVGNKFLTEHVLGTWDSGYIVELNITVPNAFSAERQQEIVDSVVASYVSPRAGS